MKQRKTKAPYSTSTGDDLEREMGPLVRQYQGLIDGLRIDWLSRRLKASDLVVRRSRANLRGDRVTLVLMDGSIVKLNLLRPEWRPFAALNSITRRDARSWIVCGRSTRGEALACDAWNASVTVSGRLVDSAPD